MKNLILILVFLQLIKAQPVPQDSTDLVWSTKADLITDFWKVKFSNTDSIIVGHCIDYTLFFDAKTGHELIRIPGKNEILFIDNDRKFIRLNQARTKFEIFNTQTFEIIDSIENDSIIIPNLAFPQISKDERYIVSPIKNGFRIWDVQNKKILKTKILEKPNEPYLINYDVTYIQFLCDINKLIGHYLKTYQENHYPYFIFEIGIYTVLDFNTLDSIDNYNDSRDFRISNTCKYFVTSSEFPTLGVKIYDLDSKQLLQTLPMSGSSLTGFEFSNDDKYLVTSNGPYEQSLLIWNIELGKQIYSYLPSFYSRLDVSNDSKYILVACGKTLRLYHFRFGETIVPEESITTLQIIYPNPFLDYLTLDIIGNDKPETIIIYDLFGRVVQTTQTEFLESLKTQYIKLNTENLPLGVYFVSVQGSPGVRVAVKAE